MSERTTKKRIYFIINPISGKKRIRDVSKLIHSNLDEDRFDIEIKYTKAAGHAKQLSKEAVDDKTDIIVAVGGDGTINEVASEMINTDVVLGIIPRGSGNGLARHLGIPRSVHKALKLINTGHFMQVDTATINGKPYVSIAGIGFDALVAREFAKNKQRGFLTYFNIIASRFMSYEPKKYQLIFDEGNSIDIKAFFISFANSNQFGYNTTIAPNAKLNDGKLDICIVNKPAVFKIPRIANLLLLNRIDESDEVRIIQTKGLSVKRKKNRVVNVDGEPIKLDKNLRVKINPLSLKVIIPKNVEKT